MTQVDWTSVSRAILRVRHHYRYVYSGPVTGLAQQLIMIPMPRHLDQRLLDERLDVRGTSGGLEVDWLADGFGNRVCHVRAERVEHAVDFEAVFSVERSDGGRKVLALPPVRISAYRAFTALTAADERVHRAADRIRSRAATEHEQVELAHDWAARSIAYKAGVTGVQTPAAMALHLGQGVCQDFAHIMLSLLRVLGIPCRYVSGHLLGEGAPHAWVEVLLPARLGMSVLAFDPTHHRRAGLSYVTVAVGRDFADVTMTSGVFSGAASGRLHWSKQADVVETTRSSEGGEAAA